MITKKIEIQQDSDALKDYGVPDEIIEKMGLRSRVSFDPVYAELDEIDEETLLYVEFPEQALQSLKNGLSRRDANAIIRTVKKSEHSDIVGVIVCTPTIKKKEQ